MTIQQPRAATAPHAVRLSDPAQIHDAFMGATNAKDVAGLLALHDTGGLAVRPDGESCTGVEAMRAMFDGLTSAIAHIDGATRKLFVVGDVALGSASWTAEVVLPDGSVVEQRGTTAEVSRRQADGSWLMIIDDLSSAGGVGPDGADRTWERRRGRKAPAARSGRLRSSVIFSLVYSSTTDHDWTQEELVELLTYSRDWNTDHGVTGLLLYRDCVFMQLLEGEEGEIRYLFSHIVTDRRHQDIDLLWTDETPGRRFGDWSMAFRELREHPVVEPGYRGDVDVPIGKDSPERPNELGDFLSMFKPA